MAIQPIMLPVPATRAGIEAAIFRLIGILDDMDAPLADMEPDADDEDTHDAELSEPGEELPSRRMAARRSWGLPA